MSKYDANNKQGTLPFAIRKSDITLAGSGMHLTDVTFNDALQTSLRIAGYTMRDLSEALGIGYGNVKRFFNPEDVKYNPSIPTVISICEFFENSIIVEWQAAQLGYQLVRVDVPKMSNCELSQMIAKTMTESADVLDVFSETLGKEPSRADLVKIRKELAENVAANMSALRAVEKMLEVSDV